MHIHMPPSETESNVAAIKRAIDSKEAEVRDAARKLDNLRAELRGLQAALKAIQPFNPKEDANGI
jgi:peptidoglycan hydrolase CwlO-like protein